MEEMGIARKSGVLRHIFTRILFDSSHPASASLCVVSYEELRPFCRINVSCNEGCRVTSESLIL